MSIRIHKLDMRGDGLSRLERELDRIADKHDIEEPLRYMPSSEFPFDPFFDEDEDDS